MPTKLQMNAVTQKIEWLKSMSYIIEEGQLVSGPVSDACQPEWESLSREQQETVLREDVNWAGFTEAQEADVIRRVLDGEDPDFWMDGVKAADPMPGNPLQRAEDEIREIKGRENNRALAPTGDLGLGEGWTVIGTVDLGKWADWSDTQRLAVLRDMVDWDGVDPADQRRILQREVDFSKVAPKDQWLLLGEVWHQNDSEPVARVPEDVRHEGFEARASPEGQAQPVRPLTQQLIDCCYLDIWPGNAAVVDFGIDSDRHLGALQHAIREELVTPQELDAAMGHGQKLTEIARRGQNPYRDVTFKTSWDVMRIEPDAAPPPSLTAAILDNPGAFLPDSGPDTDHDHGPERGR